MRVIKFPRCGSPKAVPDPQAPNLALGSVPFTCPTCSNQTRFDLLGVIFRHIEFFCARCGSAYKVTNPGLTRQPKVRK